MDGLFQQDGGGVRRAPAVNSRPISADADRLHIQHATMKYLDVAQLEAIAPAEFNARKPFPWCNPAELLTAAGFDALTGNMPNLEQFRSFFGKQRKHGQKSHDRYVLDYEQGMELSPQWMDFIDELKGDTYRRFVANLLGVRAIRFRFHWHYTPSECEVSPHCDSVNKLGSHIFYMNTEQDWDASWGGATVLLDDRGSLSPNSSPSFDKFESQTSTRFMGNRSLIIGRRGNSWHGVRPLSSPENTLRKVFIVVFYGVEPIKTAWKRLRRAISGRELVTEKERLIY
jgi:hypothetical protein